MASETDVVNGGLLRIGEKRVSDITENSNAGRLALQFYETTRDAILSVHPWNFAIKIVQLAESTPTPVSKWDHRYALPGDVIRSLEINESGIERLTSTRRWEVQGKEILTNATEVFLQYIARITAIDLFHPMFREALEIELSSKFAIAIKNDNGLARSQHELFLETMINARHSDAVEGDHDTQIERDIVDARRSFGDDILFRPFGSF